MNETPGIVSAVINLLTAGICGACANGWYLSHARQLIADARSGGLENEDLLRELSTRGGVSLLASLGTCFSLTAALAILLTIEGFVVRSF